MIVRIKKTENYSVIANELLRREDVSARAKGVYAYLMTLPDDWKLYKGELGNHFTEGRDAINKAFKELESLGYIKKCPARKEGGQVSGWDYDIYESPHRLTEKPSDGKTVKRKNRQTENPQLPNTKSLPNTKKQSTNKSEPKTPIEIWTAGGYDKYEDFVYLHPLQLRKLEDQYGSVNVKQYIRRLDQYMTDRPEKGPEGKKAYKDHYKVLRNWMDAAGVKNPHAQTELSLDEEMERICNV